MAAPILVLGLGNMLLRDDGAGLELLDALRKLDGKDPRIEFLDGGTLGLALLPHIAERHGLLVLDAIRLGAEPGTVHRVDDVLAKAPAHSAGAKGGAHQANAGDLLRTAALLGEMPRHAVIVGVEPKTVRTGVGLTAPVRDALPRAADCAHHVLLELLDEIAPPCTS
ncbi:MAG: hydrogenase maturation protease [Planctomycetota bacterium]